MLCWNIHYTARERQSERKTETDRQKSFCVSRTVGVAIRQKHNCFAGVYIILQERDRQRMKERDRQKKKERDRQKKKERDRQKI